MNQIFQSRMLHLALDIETLGLLDKSPLPEITCACLYDGINEYMLQFYKVPLHTQKENMQRLIELLDSADRLIGYNLVLFDLEFIKQSFNISEEKMTSWVQKSIDPFMYLKFVLKQTSKLSSLLALNDLAPKAGSGLQAISWALEGQYDKLLHYCLMDAKLVFTLCHQKEMKVMNSHDRLSLLSVDMGRWTITDAEGPPPSSNVSKRKRRAAFSLPQVAGTVLNDVTMAQVLHSRPVLINPEDLDWIFIVDNA